jgi:glycosyltransferase involved in cell wall biosynthesis
MCIAADRLAASAERSIRILIVTYAFPPLNAIASHRPYSWAKAWRELGHEIEVLTFAKHPVDGALDLQRDLAGMRVHEIGYLPRPRGSVARWEKIKAMTRRVRFSLGMFGDPRLLAAPALARAARKLGDERRFDLVVATAPPEITFMAARAMCKRTGAPWVADFRDHWSQDMTLYRSRLAAWLTGPLNRWLVAPAAALVTVSRGLQKRLAAEFGREVLVSYNGFFAADAVTPRAPADGRRHIVYTGRLYPDKQDPEPLLRALRTLRQEMPDLAQRLAVDFYGHDDPALRALLERYGVADCVKLYGFVPYTGSIAAQRSADVLLYLDWTDARGEGMLTGKLFEYLGAGRPILALAARTGSEATQLVTGAGAGRVLTRDEEVVAYLRELLAAPRPSDVATPGVERFSRERQAQELLQSIRKELGI